MIRLKRKVKLFKTVSCIKTCLGIIIFFGCSNARSQSVPDSLSLQQVLEMVILKNPMLKQAEGRVYQSSSKIGIAKSNRYPKVILEGSYTHIDPVSEVVLPLGELPLTLPLFPNNNWNVHAGVQYVLYDFGRTNEVVNISKIERLIAREGLEAAQKQLTYAATELFNTILFTEKAILVQEKLIKSLNRTLVRTNGFIEHGLATSFDRVNTNVRIATAQNKKVRLQNSLSQQKHHLKELMDIEPNTPIHIKGALSIEQQSFDLIYLSTKSRNELNIAQYIDSIAKSGQKLAKKGNLPIATVGASTGFHNGYLPDLQEFRFNYAAFAKVTIPLFQGFKVKHEKDIQKVKRANSKWHLKEVKAKIDTELSFAQVSLVNALAQYQNNKILIRQAKIAVQQARKKYENQLITNLDLLDTEVALAGAQLALLESDYKCVMAHYKLQQAQGVKIW